MQVSRRQVLSAGAAASALSVLPALTGRVGAAFGATGPDPATRTRRRLVVIYQGGGNDGLNTVVPVGDVPGAPRYSVYRSVRPSIGFTPAQPLRLDRPEDRDQLLGLHPSLTTIHGLYRAGRAAVVQGVDYPDHDYSHFRSNDIWQSGEPDRSPDSGWLGRHLDRVGIGEGELRAVALGDNEVPLLLRGQRRQGSGITSIPATRFADGTAAPAEVRHDALAGFGGHPAADLLAAYSGRQDRATVGIVRALAGTRPPPATGSSFADAMLGARTLLEQDLGVECVFVLQPGYDTHTDQRQEQDARLADLDAGIEAFFTGRRRGQDLGVGPLGGDLAARTLVMFYSEFGRRLGENGTGAAAGTDHGAAAPLLLLGPSHGARRLVPGLHGDHPDLGTVALPADNLMMTTDLRRVYSAVLQEWLDDPDPLYGSLPPLPGLFASAGR